MFVQKLRRTATCAIVTSGLSLIGPTGGSPSMAATAAPELEDDALVRSEAAAAFVPTKKGASVTPGTSVESGPGVASVLKIADGVSVRLAPGSTITLHTTSWLPVESPGAHAVKAYQVQLNEGELDLDAHDPAGGIGLLVMLPGGRNMALWRGSASVAVHGEDVAVGVYDGMGIAGSAAQWRPLPPRAGVVLGAKTVSPTKKTLPAPTWLDGANDTPPSFAIVRGDERAVLGASWQAVPGAASYRVEVARDRRVAGALDVSKADAASTQTQTAPLAAGSYYVRVRAIAPDGIVGAPSPAKELRVAHLSIPSAAFAAAGGAVVLGEAQALTLDDPRDLEIAEVSELAPKAPPEWAPATTRLTLAEQPKRTLLIRHALSHVQTRVTLVRRDLHARISFTPPHPWWPDTPVDIVVKVEDPSGYLDPAREALTFDVHVDLDRENPSWTHAGDTWTARVAPHVPPGPWVVRVGARDWTGAAVGEALLDVDGPQLRQAGAAR